jgi:hypothetical protein
MMPAYWPAQIAVRRVPLPSEEEVVKFELREYARRGAEARAAELKAELEEIYRIFPDMRRGRVRAGASAAAVSRQRSGRRRRKPMSAAQRKAVSARMKKYWAARRKAQAK